MHTLVLIIVCMYGCMIDCMDTNTDTDTNNAVFIHSSPLRAARAQIKGTDRMTSECWVMGYAGCIGCRRYGPAEGVSPAATWDG